jgi:hypothetical protein
MGFMGKKASKQGECLYCGERRALTRDHVPPSCLFSNPKPGNLITVPSCNLCNGQFSKHDEYFRLVVALGIDSSKFPKENADSVRAIKSLGRQASRGFAMKLLQSYQRGPARLTIDRTRVEIVLNRIATGLFYHHENERFPQGMLFGFLEAESENLPPAGRESIARLQRNLSSIGQGTFRYAYECEKGPGADPFGTVWLMRFYDHRTFFCATASN